MYLPYLNESDEKTYVKHFLENIEYAIINGLKQLEIEDERIKHEFEKIKEEVIGNGNYKYNED
jgi:lipoate-protein ligase B